MIRCVCPHCSTAHVLDNLMRGQPFTCPDCGRRLRVPSAKTGTATQLAANSSPVSSSATPLTVPSADATPPATPVDASIIRGRHRLLAVASVGSCILLILAILVAVYDYRWRSGNDRQAGRSSPPVLSTAEFAAEYEKWLTNGGHPIAQSFVVTGKVAAVSEPGAGGHHGYRTIVINRRGELPANDSVLFIIEDQPFLPHVGQEVRAIGSYTQNWSTSSPALYGHRITVLSGSPAGKSDNRKDRDAAKREEIRDLATSIYRANLGTPDPVTRRLGWSWETCERQAQHFYERFYGPNADQDAHGYSPKEMGLLYEQMRREGLLGGTVADLEAALTNR